jgi:hypothetical protein
MTLLCLMPVTRARVPWFQIWTLYVFINIFELWILSASYMHLLLFWTVDPEVTIIGILSRDDCNSRSSCIHYVLMLCSGSPLKGGLNIPKISLWTPLPREGRTKDAMQVLTISMYDYIRNTCLHWIDELELLCIALGCDCYMMNVIHTNTHHWSNAYALLILIFAKLLLLLLLLQSLQNCYCYCHRYYGYCYRYYIKLSYHCATNTLLQKYYFPGVVELTTQLLRHINILWLPLCRINKFGLKYYPRRLSRSPILVGYHIPVT